MLGNSVSNSVRQQKTESTAPNGQVPKLIAGETSLADTRVSKDFGRGSSDGNDIGLFNESIRSLMRSSSISKIDYALSRAQSECMSFYLGLDVAVAVKEFAAATSENELTKQLSLGRASKEVRHTSFRRSFDKCSKLFEGARISQQEMDTLRLLPSFDQYRAVKAALNASQHFDRPEEMAALSQAVLAPMFGALASVIANKVDFAELVAAYGRERVVPLYDLTIPLVLCRMGDDCGSGGIVTEQLCWERGICGDRVEEAILDNLRAKGVDTRALEQFITRVHLGLQNRDPAIFKKPR